MARLQQVFRLMVGLLFASPPQQTAAGSVSLPSYPLAVKSPYLSTWCPGHLLKNAPTAKAQFWTGTDLTWPIVARVGGTTYSLFGDPGNNCSEATTDSITYTSTHTYVTLTAGSASFTLDFFSPVLPSSSDYVQQSLPYSYLTVSATSSKSTSVQVLSAIDQTWTAQDGAADLNFTSAGSSGFFWFNNPKAIPFTEDSDMATYGSVLFGTTIGGKVSHACASSSDIYNAFEKKGSLSSLSSKSCSGDDLAALSKNLGTVGTSNASVTFIVGFDRVQAINYLNDTQTGYYRSKYPTVPEAVECVLQDYATLLPNSLSFDTLVRSRSEAVSASFGSQYADIVEASVRQTFGAIELTVPIDDLSSEPSVFLKEISSDGNVNTVDLIFQSWPVFISLNPEYIKLLFKPIVSYLNSGQWPLPYVIHDIGTHYPNATGHNDGIEEPMPLFETSTLFILLYAYQKYTGDTSYAKQYLPLLDGYAKYLAKNSLYPGSQLISVDAIAQEANQTALAIQSTIGLQAASILTGNDSYADLAASFVKKIYNEGLGLNGDSPKDSTHFTYYYGKDKTWNVLFTAFADVVLGLDTFPKAAWKLQSTWYQNVIQELGLPFAGPENYTQYIGGPLEWGLADWNVVAASVSSTAVQQAVISTTHQFLTNGLNDIPFGTKYYVEGPEVGHWIANEARSSVGSFFALAALQQGQWTLPVY